VQKEQKKGGIPVVFPTTKGEPGTVPRLDEREKEKGKKRTKKEQLDRLFGRGPRQKGRRTETRMHYAHPMNSADWKKRGKKKKGRVLEFSREFVSSARRG